MRVVVGEMGDPTLSVTETSLQEPRKTSSMPRVSDAMGNEQSATSKRPQRLKGFTGCDSLVLLS
jgi:hypothetical protein